MANFKHGETGTPLYDVWHHMKQRCHNIKNLNYWTVVSRLDRLGWSIEKALGGDVHE